MLPRDACAQLRAIARLRDIQRMRAEHDAREAMLVADRERDALGEAESARDGAIEGWIAAASSARPDPSAGLRWAVAVADAVATASERLETSALADEGQLRALESWSVSGVRAEQGADAYAAALRAADRYREERTTQDITLLHARSRPIERRV